MIIFNEGLPRSGKSHDAVKSHVFPAVRAGRRVVAYIEGLNPEKIAAAVGVEAETVKGLITVLTRDDVPEIWKHCGKDAIVVIDEAQNYWPSQRQPLKPEMQRFIAEHGHDGLDIVLMGQCLSDVHPAWRRRVSQKVVFTKMEAVGQATRYTWISYKASSPEKFHESQKGPLLGESYDPVVFECYKSHNDGTENKDTYKDPRGNIFNSAAFRYGLPIALLAIFYGGWHVLQNLLGRRSR
ncbi:MAG: zonular occludens toxin domain-containing protein [Propionivibrio sp.]